MGGSVELVSYEISSKFMHQLVVVIPINALIVRACRHEGLVERDLRGGEDTIQAWAESDPRLPAVEEAQADVNAFLASGGELVVVKNVVAAVRGAFAPKRANPTDVRFSAVLQSVRYPVLNRGMWKQIVHSHHVQGGKPPEFRA